MFLIIGETKTLCFQNLQLVTKSCENPLKWWKAHKAQFLILGYLTCQILDIVESQIEAGEREGGYIFVLLEEGWGC